MTTRHSNLKVFLLTCLLAAPVTTLSAAPGSSLFSYRGQLTDNGVSADGNYDFEFALYTAAVGGAPVDTIVASALEVHKGLLDTPLDFIAPSDGTALWVEVRMRSAGSPESFATLAPRQALAMSQTVRSIIGPSAAGKSYDVAFPANTLIGGGSPVTLASVNVPAGSYVAFVRMQAQTGSEVNPGNNYRFDCTLSPNFDDATYRVGYESSVERYVTFQGATTLDSAGAIQFSCRDGNAHTDIVLGGKLTVMSVSAVN